MPPRSAERFHIIEQAACFACGPNHPHGLRLVFAADVEGNQVAQWTASPTWEGFAGVIHGGILATLADEAMAKAVVTQGWEAMTGELQIRYLTPVPVGTDLVICGKIVRQRKRLIYAEATIHKSDGTVCLRAKSTFVIVPGASIAP